MEQYIESFAEYISPDISQGSIAVYVGAVRQFYKFMRQKGYIKERDILDHIDNQIMSKFVQYIKATNKSRSATNNIITGVRKFVDYLYNVHRIPERIIVPTSRHKKIVCQYEQDNLPAPYDLIAMLINNHKISIQDIPNIKITNINFNALNVGSRRIILTPQEIKLLIQYLESRKYVDSEYLFVDDNGKPIDLSLLRPVV